MEVDLNIKGQHIVKEKFCILTLSVSQYLGHDIILQFCRMLPLGGSKEYTGQIIIHITFLQLQVNLQLCGYKDLIETKYTL